LIALTLSSQRQAEAETRVIDEYCRVIPPNAVAQLFGFDFGQNPFEGVAAFPVLREFLSPCACGTTTQDTNKVRPMTREAHSRSLRPIRAAGRTVPVLRRVLQGHAEAAAAVS
jgi:hypothetical protein